MAERHFPAWVEPMAATLTHERFSGPEWVFERKLDGIRLLAFKRGPDVRLLSRNQLEQNAHYPSFVDALARLPVSELILDGEATGVWGKQQVEGYHVFDVLWLEGRDVTALPLEQRRELLESLPLAPPLERVARLDGAAPWERACREGWEGVIAKRLGSVYEQRRSPHWLKMKCEASQELVVGGFTDPQGQRQGLGALLVGYYDGAELVGETRSPRRVSPHVEEGPSADCPIGPGSTCPSPAQRGRGEPGTNLGHEVLVFAGKVGTGAGFDVRGLVALRARLDAIELPAAPFTRGSGLPRLGAHWVRPELVVQVAFLEWTVHGKLRHPRLLGLREDKSARDVTRETA
jgi:bifunctional non-homologous end joining protein LigD